MFAHTKQQMENFLICESGFTIDRIMHSHISFHKLALTRDSSVQLREWIAKKKVASKLRMTADGKNTHYTAIINLSRLLKSFNAARNRAYHF